MSRLALLADVLLPHRCPACRCAGPSPCDACIEDLAVPAAAVAPPGVDRFVAVAAYQGGARAIVAAVKFRGDRGPLPWLAAELAARLGPPPEPAVVSWIPAAAPHRRRRGIDGAELLARAVAGELGVAAHGLLRRAPGPPQAGRSAAERHLGPVLRCRPPVPATVVVVDDVLTTGGSAAAAARALRGAGASSVWVATIAHTAPPGP